MVISTDLAQTRRTRCDFVVVVYLFVFCFVLLFNEEIFFSSGYKFTTSSYVTYSLKSPKHIPLIEHNNELIMRTFR